MTNYFTTVQENIAIDELRKISDHIKPIKKDSLLFSEGAIADELFIINSGIVKIGKLTLDGRDLSIRLSEEGNIIGELFPYAKEIKHMHNAKVIEDGEVTVVKMDRLREELLLNNRLAINLMEVMSNNSRRDQMRIRDLVSYGKKGALYSTLIRLTNSYGEDVDGDILINIKLTNVELASFCSTSRESVNRILNDLRRRDIVSINEGHIIIHDLQYLRDAVNCENCSIDLCSIH